MTTRRAVLAGGAALTVGVCAACAGRDPGPAATGTPAASAGTSEPDPGGTGAPGALARLEDLEVGMPVAVAAGEVPLLLLRTADDTVVAFSAVCPHQGCTVLPDGGAFACPCHRSQFAADGAVTSGPSPSGLVPVTVTVEDGTVTLA